MVTPATRTTVRPQSSLGFRESRRGGLPRGRIRSRHDHLVTPVGRHDRRRIARCKDFVACERGDLKLRLSQRRRTNQLARRTLIGLRGRRYFAEQRTQLINRQSTGGGAERFATGRRLSDRPLSERLLTVHRFAGGRIRPVENSRQHSIDKGVEIFCTRRPMRACVGRLGHSRLGRRSLGRREGRRGEQFVHRERAGKDCHVRQQTTQVVQTVVVGTQGAAHSRHPG